MPHPFPLQSLARHDRAVAEFEQRKSRLDDQERQRRVFRARPLSEDMLNGATFVPTLGTAPLTEPEDVVTASRDRAHLRAEFDSHTAKRIAEEEQHNAEQEAARLAQEEDDMRKHWKQHGFRARPVPSSTYAVPPSLHRSMTSHRRALRPSNETSGSGQTASRQSTGSSKSWSPTAEQGQDNLKTPLKLGKEENTAQGKDASSSSTFSPSELIANVKRVIQSYREHSPKVGTPV